MKTFYEILREAISVPEIKFIKDNEVINRQPHGALHYLKMYDPIKAILIKSRDANKAGTSQREFNLTDKEEHQLLINFLIEWTRKNQWWTKEREKEIRVTKNYRYTA